MVLELVELSWFCEALACLPRDKLAALESGGIERMVITWVIAFEKNLSSRWR